MKKFLVALVVLIFSSNVCLADPLNLETETKYQKKIMQIGFKVLNSNKIDKRVTFHYIADKKVNAYALDSHKSVMVFKGLLPYLDNDEELAGILSHEIAHNVDFHAGFWRKFAMGFARKKYEIKADKKAVDYMVHAGYNPLAMIIALNKLAGEGYYTSHPSGSDRLAYVYEYIYKKYPAYLVENDYLTNIYYQNFLLTSKGDREKIRARYEKHKRREKI